MSYRLPISHKIMIERNVVIKDPRKKTRVALVYPNKYKAGMANLGFHIVYDILNSMENVFCERFFLDMDRSLETNSPLRDFPLIAFSWQFELDSMNILKILEKNGVPLKREERKEHLVIMGGPCTANPMTMKNFIDIFFLGEAEPNLGEFMDLYSSLENPRTELEKFLEIPGLYLPRYNNQAKKVVMKDLDSYYPTTQVISPEVSFGETFILEVSRGCHRGCRFCMGGFTFRPRRERSIEKLKEIIEEGIKANDPKKISLIGASVSDYSHIHELMDFLLEKRIEISIPSLRIDNLDNRIIETLVASGQKTLTLAPESCQRLRDVMNKNITDGQIIEAARKAVNGGIKKLKLYFILGLPGEEEKDVEDIVHLVELIKNEAGKRLRLRLSINPFVPKPHTPWQWCRFPEIGIVKKRFKYLKKALKNIAIVEMENLKESRLQAAIAMGDSTMSDIILRAHKYGGGLGAFRKAFKDFHVPFDHYISEKTVGMDLPWDGIDFWIDEKFLEKEHDLSC